MNRENSFNNDYPPETYEYFFKLSRDLFVVTDFKGNILHLNSAWETVLGYSLDEIYSFLLCRIIHPHDRDKTAMELEHLPDAKSQSHFECRLLKKDGSYIWLEWNGQVDGKRNLIYSVGRDITRRKETELALNESEAYLRTLLKDHPELICRFLADGTFTFVNEVYCRFFGKSCEDLKGSKWHKISLSVEVPRIEKKLKTLSLSNPIIITENRVHSATGEIRWLQSVNRGHFDKHGNLVEIQAVGRDITALKKKENALRNSEIKFRTFFESVNDAAFLIDFKDNRIIEVNPAATDMYGFSAEEFKHMKNFNFPVKAENVRKMKKFVPLSIQTRKDGSMFPSEISINAFQLDGRKIVIGLVRDITDRKQSEIEREGLIEELQSSLEKVNLLSGFLPICSSCKKILDGDGKWRYLEEYISKHSEAEFTHSLCPDCTEKLYSEIDGGNW